MRRRRAMIVIVTMASEASEGAECLRTYRGTAGHGDRVAVVVWETQEVCGVPQAKEGEAMVAAARAAVATRAAVIVVTMVVVLQVAVASSAARVELAGPAVACCSCQRDAPWLHG